MSDAKDLIELILKRSGGRPNGPRGTSGAGGPRPNGVSPRVLIAGVAVLVALWGLLSAVYTVQPEERAVIKRFGNVTGIADPGLHFKLPFGIDRIQVVATERVLQQEFGFRTDDDRPSNDRSQFAGGYPDESLMLTGDLNIIQVEWVVQYRISDPVKYLYGMREPQKTLRDLSESVMRRVVGNRIGTARFRGRSNELRFVNVAEVEQTPMIPETSHLDDYARVFPFSLASADVPGGRVARARSRPACRRRPSPSTRSPTHTAVSRDAAPAAGSRCRQTPHRPTRRSR